MCPLTNLYRKAMAVPPYTQLKQFDILRWVPLTVAKLCKRPVRLAFTALNTAITNGYLKGLELICTSEYYYVGILSLMNRRVPNGTHVRRVYQN